DVHLHLRDGISHGDVQRCLILLLVEQRLVLREQRKRGTGYDQEDSHCDHEFDQGESRLARVPLLRQCSNIPPGVPHGRTRLIWKLTAGLTAWLVSVT